LFNNQLNIFECKLVLQYFKYSGQVLHLDYLYTDWIVDFRRRYRLVNPRNFEKVLRDVNGISTDEMNELNFISARVKNALEGESFY
jgi:hypothetical protein